jgi:hypothetical protein
MEITYYGDYSYWEIIPRLGLFLRVELLLLRIAFLLPSQDLNS